MDPLRCHSSLDLGSLAENLNKAAKALGTKLNVSRDEVIVDNIVKEVLPEDSGLAELINDAVVETLWSWMPPGYPDEFKTVTELATSFFQTVVEEQEIKRGATWPFGCNLPNLHRVIRPLLRILGFFSAKEGEDKYPSEEGKYFIYTNDRGHSFYHQDLVLEVLSVFLAYNHEVDFNQIHRNRGTGLTLTPAQKLAAEWTAERIILFSPPENVTPIRKAFQ